jgi:spore coat polysaccharide biosynthesis protein SpsF
LHVSSAKKKGQVRLVMGETKPKVAAIVQTRMGSTRLPGKVLMDLSGDTVLARVLCRLRRATQIHEIVVATTTATADRAIVHESERLGFPWFCGSEDDVLGRYYQAAQAFDPDIVVRITSDCPLIDPELVDDTVRAFFEQHADYASNALFPTYPQGLSTEVFTRGALHKAWNETCHAYEREHVTPYFYEHPEIFRLVSVAGATDYSRYRWTLDTREDLTLIRAIYARMSNRDDFGWRDTLALMDREPELAEINSHILQKPLHLDEHL